MATEKPTTIDISSMNARQQALLDRMQPNWREEIVNPKKSAKIRSLASIPLESITERNHLTATQIRAGMLRTGYAFTGEVREPEVKIGWIVDYHELGVYGARSFVVAHVGLTSEQKMFLSGFATGTPPKDTGYSLTHAFYSLDGTNLNHANALVRPEGSVEIFVGEHLAWTTELVEDYTLQHKS